MLSSTMLVTLKDMKLIINAHFPYLFSIAFSLNQMLNDARNVPPRAMTRIFSTRLMLPTFSGGK